MLPHHAQARKRKGGKDKGRWEGGREERRRKGEMKEAEKGPVSVKNDMIDKFTSLLK